MKDEMNNCDSNIHILHIFDGLLLFDSVCCSVYLEKKTKNWAKQYHTKTPAFGITTTTTTTNNGIIPYKKIRPHKGFLFSNDKSRAYFSLEYNEIEWEENSSQKYHLNRIDGKNTHIHIPYLFIVIP